MVDLGADGFDGKHSEPVHFENGRPGHYFRFRVFNKSHSETAKNVVVTVSEIKGLDGFVIDSLTWTFTGAEATSSLGPGRDAICNLGFLFEPTAGAEPALVLATARNETRTIVLGKGRHNIALKIAADDVPPATAWISVTLDGGYVAGREMYSKHAVVAPGPFLRAPGRVTRASKRLYGLLGGSALSLMVLGWVCTRYGSTGSKAPKEPTATATAAATPDPPVVQEVAVPPAAPTPAAAPTPTPKGRKHMQPPAPAPAVSGGKVRDQRADNGGINIGGDVKGPAIIGGDHNSITTEPAHRQLTAHDRLVLDSVPKGATPVLVKVTGDGDYDHYAVLITNYLKGRGIAIGGSGMGGTGEPLVGLALNCQGGLCTLLVGSREE